MSSYMEGFEAFRYYQSIKLHFESKSYDAIKYNYKTSVNINSFGKRKDKYFFSKIAKQFNNATDLINYYVAHFISGNSWVGEMLADESIYREWVRKNESLSYMFEQDLYKLQEINESLDVLLDCLEGHPPIVSAYIRDDISIETVVIINHLSKFMDKADKRITETIMWPDISHKIRKYGPFITFDPDKMTKIILKVFTK